MKTSLLKMLAVVAVPSMLAVGCGGDDDKKTTTTTHDLAVTKSTGDMAAKAGCTTFGAWSSANVFASTDTTETGYDYIDDIYGAQADATDSSNFDLVDYSFYHSKGAAAPTTPETITLTSSMTYGTCSDCVTAVIDTDGTNQTPGTFYFAQSGSITVSSLAKGSETGTITVSGTNVHFVQWDYSSSSPMMDAADPSGACLDVGSFSFSAKVTPPADMGS